MLPHRVRVTSVRLFTNSWWWRVRLLLASVSQVSTVGALAKRLRECQPLPGSAAWYVTGRSADLLAPGETFRAAPRDLELACVVRREEGMFGPETPRKVSLVLFGDARTYIWVGDELRTGDFSVMKVCPVPSSDETSFKNVGGEFVGFGGSVGPDATDREVVGAIDAYKGEVPVGNGRLVLSSGRAIKIIWLRQFHTYSFLRVGEIPTRDMNKQIIEVALGRRERGWKTKNGPNIETSLGWGCRGGPFLVPPVETPILGTRETSSPPAALPRIQCTAGFSPEDGRSGLTLVWFQEDFALPIDPDVQRRIQAIDWDAMAGRAFPLAEDPRVPPRC
jgi:hypothetical protein